MVPPLTLVTLSFSLLISFLSLTKKPGALPFREDGGKEEKKRHQKEGKANKESWREDDLKEKEEPIIGGILKVF